MRVISFLTEPTVVDGIIEHLKLNFAAERLPSIRAVIGGRLRD